MKRKYVFCCDNCKQDFESDGPDEATIHITVKDMGYKEDYLVFDGCMECRRMFLRIFQKPTTFRLPAMGV